MHLLPAVAALLMTLAVASYAEPPLSSFAAKAIQNHSVPDGLGAVFVQASDACGLDRSAVERMVDGVLIRSRIEKESLVSALGLWVDAWCIAAGPDNNAIVYYVTAEFVYLDGEARVTVRETYNGGLGLVFDSSDVFDVLKTSVEDATIDFIYAHSQE